MEPFVDAARKAAIAALVTLGLAFPIVVYRTDVNLSNQLVLTERWHIAFLLAGIAFALRFVIALARPTGFQPRVKAAAEDAAPPHPFRAYLPHAALALLVAYPFLVVAIAGNAGAVKWIDNYGVQILIYILLAWGLNIIVGYAGLLDLGFVASYAVGAYASALLMKTYGISFWMVLPLAGVLAAVWGLIVGMPVLRLRGDYIAIVTLAFAE